MVANLPTLPALLSRGVNLESAPVEVDCPLDTCATMCYIADTLLLELEPTLDPRAVKWIPSRVRMGAPPAAYRVGSRPRGQEVRRTGWH